MIRDISIHIYSFKFDNLILNLTYNSYVLSFKILKQQEHNLELFDLKYMKLEPMILLNNMDLWAP